MKPKKDGPAAKVKPSTPKQSRALKLTKFVEDFDKRNNWVDLAVAVVAVEEEKLFVEVGHKTWEEWVEVHAGNSKSRCYAVKSQLKVLRDHFTIAKLKRIPPESAKWLSKAKNISPDALSSPEVQAACTLPPKQMIKKLKADLPDQHIEEIQKVKLRFSTSLAEAFEDAFAAFKYLKDENATQEDFVEYLFAELWMEEALENGTVRDLWEAKKGNAQTILADQAQATEAQSAIA